MDIKLAKFSEVERWQKLMPKWIAKKISPDVLDFLANPNNRNYIIEMISNGEWEIAPPKALMIPKDNGDFRKVWSLTNLDRCIMSVIASVYTEMYSKLIHPSCVSYQEGLGVPKILHEVCRHLGDGGYKVDLTKYFDSVNIQSIEDTLNLLSSNSPLDQLLWDFYHDDRVFDGDKLIVHYKSLAQGCAFSALLANVCLREIDAKLSKMCTVYYRYCDDILLIGPDAENALKVLKEMLSSFGLSLNPNKIERIDEASEFSFLGGMISKDCVHMKKTTLVAEKKIIKSCCKGLKKGSRSEQKRAIKRIQQKFFNGDRNDHHAFEWLAALCTDCSDIRTLDEYAKDCIKAVYTGKGNKVTNLRKTSNKILEELGWVSLVDLWNAFTYSRNVYSALIKDANERCVKPLRVENVLSFAEERWELLKLWEGSTFLNTSPKTDNIYTKVEYDRQRDAIIEVESAIQGSEWIWGNKWFVQSQKYPKLVLLRRWFSK